MINPFKNKKGLGRGLSSLIGDSDVKITNNKISISSIIPNKYQPRKNFDKNSLEELTASIRERGIIQPIIVRASEDSNDKYELIAGERRWQAAQNAGLHEVPAVILNVDNLLDKTYMASAHEYGVRPNKPQSFMAGFILDF